MQLKMTCPPRDPQTLDCAEAQEGQSLDTGVETAVCVCNVFSVTSCARLARSAGDVLAEAVGAARGEVPRPTQTACGTPRAPARWAMGGGGRKTRARRPASPAH